MSVNIRITHAKNQCYKCDLYGNCYLVIVQEKISYYLCQKCFSDLILELLLHKFEVNVLFESI
jgi:hypothetical protein